jgi:hypothetical protein
MLVSVCHVHARVCADSSPALWSTEVGLLTESSIEIFWGPVPFVDVASIIVDQDFLTVRTHQGQRTMSGML